MITMGVSNVIFLSVQYEVANVPTSRIERRIPAVELAQGSCTLVHTSGRTVERQVLHLGVLLRNDMG